MKITKHTLVLKITFLFLVFGYSFYITPKVIHGIPTIETENNALVTRVAPGEFLPISVKILNFGSSAGRVDATIIYQILDYKGQEVYTSTETVAIETTASFVKTAQIPFDLASGTYIAKASITYKDQITEAVTQFPFKVEQKLFGLFISDFYRYALFFVPISIFMVLFGNLAVKRRNKTRFSPHDYSLVPTEERVFFELVSDTIMEMRQRVGDQALYIAKDIDGLKIDLQTGRVLELNERPSKVIALLVLRYEEVLDKKVSFKFRK